ncbi:MAG: hypothetical protein SWJ54_06820 [Cyanobacteriota bacterium]|nr:hypothetical protein [Cyanobacteriota bacterium]
MSQEYLWQTINFCFPDDPNFQLPSHYTGKFREELHGEENPTLNFEEMWKDQDHDLTIPSHYGRIWTVS